MGAKPTPHSPGSYLITIKSLALPSGRTRHDLSICLDRKLAESLHAQLGEALASNATCEGTET
jgi:hypothetical protein